MFYFLGIDIPQVITGVDRAMFNRLKIFQNNNQPAKLLYFNYYPNLFRNAKIFGVQNDIKYLYDYYHEVPSTFSRESINWLDYFEIDKGYTTLQVNQSNDYNLFQNGKIVAYARFYDNTLKELEFMIYYDSSLRKIRMDYYDSRGFKSSEVYYDHNENPIFQNILSLTGEIKVQRYYDSDNIDKIKHVIVKIHHGEELIFQSEHAFLAFTLESIYKDGDYFIIDRPLEMVPVFNLMDTSIPASVFIHSVHYDDMYVENPTIQYTFQQLFNSLSRFNALIVSTYEQKKDLEALTQNKIKIFNIPVGYQTQVQSKNNLPKKHQQRLISIARFENGKQHEHQFRLINKLKQEIPHISLHLYGYGSLRSHFQQTIQEMSLEEHVFIHEFEPDLTEVYNKADLSIFTSKFEGFALTILESIAHNTPVIAYDIKYGPRTIIKHNINGYLIEPNNEEMLYTCVRDYLNNNMLQDKLCSQCFDSIIPFNLDSISEKWMTFTQSDIY
ncbi:hypothetical protein BHU61_11960 [Macrococcus epidermidis]|uniref:Glycosyl transferase family 1 domain-containing protein n=1 Tax=Macrococcus epidermidis TaxID=1902580 RepID=A0A327ZNC9_9STAP|nr:glycosyltransferase [Macrococcus epidermidis]RAK43882.1 hypothetical protein BHU61_11960 [Macrococcus epidermidis]